MFFYSKPREERRQQSSPSPRSDQSPIRQAQDVEYCQPDSPCSTRSSTTSYDDLQLDDSSDDNHFDEWDGRKSSMKIRNRPGGRRSLPWRAASSEDSSSDDEDRVPLVRSDSFSSEGFSLAMVSNMMEATGIGSKLITAVRLIIIAIALATFIYHWPSFGLESFYFPARGVMMPGAVNGYASTPVFDYKSPLKDKNNNDDRLPEFMVSEPVEIPRIVHVTYKSRDQLPPEWEESLRQWKKMNPTWEVRFWSDDDLAKFVHEEFPEMEDFWNSYPYMIQRVDSVRYMILYHFGGVYSDMDIYPATSLDKLLEQWEDAGKKVMLTQTLNHGVTNALMAAAPRSRFMGCVIDNLPNYKHAWFHIIHWRHWEILSSAGSTFLWGMLGHCQDEEVEVLAARSFRQCSVCDSYLSGREIECDTPWFHHSSTNSSWHKPGSWYWWIWYHFSYGSSCLPYRMSCIYSLILVTIVHRLRSRKQQVSQVSKHFDQDTPIRARKASDFDPEMLNR